jgi:glutaredoxin 3
MPEVIIYTTTYCSYCNAAKQFLSKVKKVPYREIDLTGNEDARLQLTERTGQKTVPQIFVGDTHVGGYTDMRALDAAGGLDPLLAG